MPTRKLARTRSDSTDLGRPLASADRSPVAAYLAGQRSEAGRRSQAGAVETIGAILAGRPDLLGRVGPEQRGERRRIAWSLPWHELEASHVEGTAAVLAERFAPATANRHLAALRGVLRAAWRLGLLTAERLERLSDVRPVSGSSPQAGRSLSGDERAALFQAAAEQSAPLAERDAALLAVLDGCGLRRSEAVGLDVGDFDAAEGALTVRRGKGRKARRVPIANGARAALEAWLSVLGDDSGPVFRAVSRGGRILPRRLTAQSVALVLGRLQESAGLERLTAHDFRRSFVGDLLDGGADVVTVQAIVGHASPATTARYDRRGERARAKAIALRGVPYTPRASAS